MANIEPDINPAFVQSPEALVDAIYKLISFGPGDDPAWQAFRALFAERCVLALRLFPGDPAISLLSLDDYVARQVRDGMKEEGYSERPLERSVTAEGDVAAATIRFEMVFGTDRRYVGVDLFQMMKRDGRWWIVSVVGELNASGAPIRQSTEAASVSPA